MSEHSHEYAHGHHHAHDATGLRLFFTILLNVMITAAEVAGGLISGSLALLSDAVHNFSDVISIIVSYVALRLSRRKSTPERTFGFKRAEVLAALFNSSGLIIISFFLFKEAWLRLVNPEPINTSVMLLVAVIGLMGNLISVLLLRQHSQQNLNVKSAYMHLLSDTLSSVAVILGGVAIYFYKIYWLDPLLVFFIGLYILRESYLILKQALNILNQATPAHIKVHEIVNDLSAFPEIQNPHHVHVW